MFAFHKVDNSDQSNILISENLQTPNKSDYTTLIKLRFHIFLFQSCDGTYKFLVISMEFAFAIAPIGPWIDALAGFTSENMAAPHYA